MASKTSTPFDKKIISILKYNTTYQYFGKLRFDELYEAQANMRRSEYHTEIGRRDARVYVGTIDGDVICGALWRLMGYNPGRFTENPFEYNGRNNIFKFVDSTTVPLDATTSRVIADVRRYLREYLTLNSTPNGRWHDVLDTTSDGYILTVFNDGHTGPFYKKARALREAVKSITTQNVSDFNDKTGPYRDRIIDTVRRRHPDEFGVKPAPQPRPQIVSPRPTTIPVQTNKVHTARPSHDIEQELDIIMEKMDNVQITLDNRANVSTELYEQACAEMSELMSAMHDIYKQYSM
ncbi:MAG: hypothetical protein NC311_00675 [Muribaculaceae bacterium]|nr:hypothetical protein [Muribaculaceae bacterium]